MAVPRYETYPIIITSAESDVNWGGNGQNSGKWGDEQDFVYQGSQSRGLAPSQLGSGVFGYENVGDADLSTSILLMWVLVLNGAYLTDAADPALWIRVTSGASWTANYNDYDIGLHNTIWIGKGWRLFAIDIQNAEESATNGSFDATSVNYIGLGTDFDTLSRKSTIVAIDQIAYVSNSTGITCTSPNSMQNSHAFTASTNTITLAGGDFTAAGFEPGDTISIEGTANNDDEYILNTVDTTTMTTIEDLTDESAVTSDIIAYFGFQDIFDKDIANDDAYGCITINRDEQFEINYLFRVGDDVGDRPSYFRSRGEIVLFADQFLGTTAKSLVIKTVQDTGRTKFELGNSTGVGDDRVGFAGSTITRVNSLFGASSALDFSSSIDTLEVFGTTFLSIDGYIRFHADGYATNTIFNSCGQIELSSAESRNLTFSGHDGPGALLWNASIDIKNSFWLANANTDADSYAIEHAASGTFDYTNLTFAGNDYDINFSAASGTLTINATESNPSTYKITGGGSSVSIVNTVLIIINVIDEDGNDVNAAQVAVYRDSDNSELMNEDTVSGTAQESFNYPGTDVNVTVKIRKSSPGATRYLPFSASAIIEDDGLTLLATLIADPRVE